MDDTGTILEGITRAEAELLCVAVAGAATEALGGMRMSALFVPEANAFVLRCAVESAPESYH